MDKSDLLNEDATATKPEIKVHLHPNHNKLSIISESSEIIIYI
jgi:hypothetical protein